MVVTLLDGSRASGAGGRYPNELCGLKLLYSTRHRSIENEVSVKANAVGTGNKIVTIRCRGRGFVYWNAVASFFTQEEQIRPSGTDIQLEREYARLVPGTAARDDDSRHPQNTARALLDRRQLLTGKTSIQSGDVIEVTLRITANRNLQYVMIEDSRPAGCEPTAQKTRFAVDGLPLHAEVRDEKVSFFMASLPKGTHLIRYTIRAELPGSYHALPARTESMYSAALRANTANSHFNIGGNAVNDPRR